MPSRHAPPRSFGFLSEPDVAVFGISSHKRTFAESVTQCLETAGYRVFLINPGTCGECYPSLSAAPVRLKSAYVATGRDNAREIAEGLINYGIEKVWFQNGSFDDQLLARCRDAGIETYTGCLIMYIQGVGFIHKCHKFLHELFGGE